jgi:hypothetical protein
MAGGIVWKCSVLSPWTMFVLIFTVGAHGTLCCTVEPGAILSLQRFVCKYTCLRTALNLLPWLWLVVLNLHLLGSFYLTAVIKVISVTPSEKLHSCCCITMVNTLRISRQCHRRQTYAHVACARMTMACSTETSYQ